MRTGSDRNPLSALSRNDTGNTETSGKMSQIAAMAAVDGTNSAPVLSGAQTVLADGEADTTYLITNSELLDGFTDPDGDALSVVDVKTANGTLRALADGWGWWFTPQDGFTGNAELQYSVVDGQGSSTPASRTISISDTLAPQLAYSSPWFGGTLKVDQTIMLHFNEKIAAGDGDLILSNGADTRVIDINDASQVTFSSGKNGGSVTIDPTDDLALDTQYTLQIADGAILDTAGNAYVQRDDASTMDFTTIASNPWLLGTNPWHEGSLKSDSNIELFFDEPVSAGNGTVTISSSEDTRVIDITDASQVLFDEAGRVVLNPTDDLLPGGIYQLQISAGAIVDADGFGFVGINGESSSDETLDLNVIGPEPLLSWSVPWDGEFLKADDNIELVFDETIIAGNGAIVISNGTDTRTIDIHDATQVRFENDDAFNFGHLIDPFPTASASQTHLIVNNPDSTNGFTRVIIDPTDDLIPDTQYSVQLAAGAITDTDGYAYSGLNEAEAIDFTVIASGPRLGYFDPTNFFSRFQVDHDIVLYFDEPVIAGSGNIVISNGTDTRTIDIQDTDQVTFNDGSVVINPANDLIADTTYSLQIASGVITDLQGQAFAGTGDIDQLRFTPIASNPTLFQEEAPWKIDEPITLHFNEAILPGKGNIIISNGKDTRTIDIRDTAQVGFQHARLTIDPVDDLLPGEIYQVTIDDTAILDTAGHAYTGTDDAGTLNFTTIGPDPLINLFYGDDYTIKPEEAFSFNFDEDVMPGSGAIVLSNSSDTRLIDINDTSQVTFSGSKVYVDPTDDLIGDTEYNVQMPAGVILDNEGHAFAGVDDTDTINFGVVGPEPHLSFSHPRDDETEVWVGSDIQLFFDETVSPGSGSIVISNGTDTRTIDIQDTEQVTFTGYNDIIINPTDNLIPDTDYFIQIDGGAIVDTEGLPYAGIHDTTTLNFSTTDIEPVIPLMPSILDFLS